MRINPSAVIPRGGAPSRSPRRLLDEIRFRAGRDYFAERSSRRNGESVQPQKAGHVDAWRSERLVSARNASDLPTRKNELVVKLSKRSADYTTRSDRASVGLWGKSGTEENQRFDVISRQVRDTFR